MYYTSELALTARLSTLEHYQSASTILLDSTDSLISLYLRAGNKALGLARRNDTLPADAAFQELGPELFNGHLQIASQARENLVRLVEAQMHSVNSLAKFVLDKTAHMAPPVVENAINTAESMMTVGENAADELCEASLKAVGEVEKKLGRATPAKRKTA